MRLLSCNLTVFQVFFFSFFENRYSVRSKKTIYFPRIRYLVGSEIFSWKWCDVEKVWPTFSHRHSIFTGSLGSSNHSGSKYSELTRPGPQKVAFRKGNALISGKTRLVKYYNLARSLTTHVLSLCLGVSVCWFVSCMCCFCSILSLHNTYMLTCIGSLHKLCNSGKKIITILVVHRGLY